MRFYEKKCKKMRFYEKKLDIFLSYAKFFRKSLEKNMRVITKLQSHMDFSESHGRLIDFSSLQPSKLLSKVDVWKKMEACGVSDHTISSVRLLFLMNVSLNHIKTSLFCQ